MTSRPSPAIERRQAARAPVAARHGPPPARPARGALLPRGRLHFLLQVAIWLGFVVAYQAARGLADRGAEEAFRNARRLIRLEEGLGAFFEPDLQEAVVPVGGLLLHAINWTYWLSQFTVVSLVLLLTYLFRTDGYFRIRDTIIVANTIGLLGYVALPTAPPPIVANETTQTVVPGVTRSAT